jgi:predicted oxidoreductase (fatty acid repression mutant protein)
MCWSNQMPIYAEAFTVFDAQACGMLHFSVWAALEHEGYGANLQHIAEGAPAIQEGIRKVLGLPEVCHNTGVAQFRRSYRPAHRKQFAPTEKRVKAVIIWA